ncbi:MAG TPA: nitric oxide reductase [Nitrospiria bacterium]|nr:nitric oxide reductase [Nitrospiria bacterium]
MTQTLFATSISLLALFFLLLGYFVPRAKVLMFSIGFYFVMTALFAGYSNWLPQVRGEVPQETKIDPGDILNMPKDKLVDMGETIIFGGVGGMDSRRTDGKGQCPLCHTFKKGDIGDRAPNLLGIGTRAAQRIKDPRYLKPNTVQTEAFPGSGRATTAEEYIAESHSCPSCFVVEGFGVKGTNDRESPMPTIHKPPVSLSIPELIAVDTFLWARLSPEEATPSPAEIKAAYEKFIPPAERQQGAPTAVTTSAPAPAGPPIALGTDTPEQIITKMGCFACHQIPTIAAAKFGPIGPLLVEKTNAPKRIASPEYQAMLKAGKAHARTPKEYVMESIVTPNAFIVHAFVQKANPDTSDMIQDFSQKFTFGALEKLADFLLTLDCDAAKKDGLKGPPAEPIDQVCGKGPEKTASLAQ